jgi:putative acyl-CoA dehydrogenase
MSLSQLYATHEVQNQPQALPAYNAWSSDLPLQQAVARHGGAWADDHLTAHGALAGGELMALGEQANRHKPALQAFDRQGRRIDHVEFHPAYHALMRHATRAQVHSYSWHHDGRPGAHVARAALLYINSQADAGTGCPLTMTHAAIPALRHAHELADEWVPRLMAPDYDPRTLPAGRKTACTIGMG